MPKITRIDCFENPNGIAVIKYPEGWTASTPPLESYINTTTSLDDMLAWFQAQGWSIRQWPKTPLVSRGLRAWRDEVKPIRSRHQIIRTRDNYKAQLRSLSPDQLSQSTWQFDFAYEA